MGLSDIENPNKKNPNSFIKNINFKNLYVNIYIKSSSFQWESRIVRIFYPGFQNSQEPTNGIDSRLPVKIVFIEQPKTKKMVKYLK